YQRSLDLSQNVLPLSNFWSESDLRQQALQNYMQTLPLDRQYRIAAVHFPDQLTDLVPDNPETAPEWWVVGENALTFANDINTAIDAFSNAIQLARANGDYYASRARAYATNGNSAAAERDLQIASFLGTTDEYPNAIHATIVTDPEAIELYRQLAIPPYGLSQEYENVVFNGRSALF